MKLTIERATLLKALGHVQNVVERRNTIPILSNVKLEATDRGLLLNATDMDMDIAELAPAEVAEPGATTAPAHTLYDIVRKLPEGAAIELSQDQAQTQLILRAGRSRFALQVLPVDDFPVMSGSDMTHAFKLAAGDLRAMVDKTRFAISQEETRYYLNGIYLHAHDRGGVAVLRAVATDGHRLARLELPLPDGAAGMPGVIVPRKTVVELRKLIDETGMDVTVDLSASKVRFTFDDTVLTSKLIDGTYPDYERVIPQGNDKILEVDRKLFFDAVDRVSAISTDKSRAIKVALERGQASLSASSPDHGTAQEEVEAAYDAAALEIGFNSRYLLDIMGQVEGDAVRLSMADSGAPTLIQDVAEASAVYVLMPMRV